MIWLIVALVLAVAASAFLSSAELAIFSLGESRVRALAEQGFRGGAALAQLRERPERVLVLLRLGDALADVTAGSLAAVIAFQRWEVVGLAIAIGVVSFIILYLGELVPIGFSVNRGMKYALALAPGLLVTTRLLGWLLTPVARLAGVRAGAREAGIGTVTEEEIRQLTVLGQTEGAIEEHERELIERAFRLDRTKTWEVMTPRVDIFAWSDSLTLRDIAPELGTVVYSRVPVYNGTIDEITGILYLRDAYQALLSGQRDVPLRALAREPLVVPGSLPLVRLLRDFQTRRIHLALVLDEYGGTDGLVTLEDVLEELVGEIEDETDVTEEPILRVSRNEILAAGDADLREINHFFNTMLPQLEHRSLNGYLLEELGRVPEPGETLERVGLRIEVLEATDTYVVRARLKRAAPEKPAGTAPGTAEPAKADTEAATERAWGT